MVDVARVKGFRRLVSRTVPVQATGEFWVGPRATSLAPVRGGAFRLVWTEVTILAELVTTRPRGTLDVLPEEAGRWQRIERLARDIAGRYGFGEIRTPTFEHTELIHRLGASTDVVQKETYDFTDRGGRQLTLRPEGTAPAVRALLQAGAFGKGLPVKVFYVTLSAFRYERKGRRPDFSDAARPEEGRALLDALAAGLRDRGVSVQTGVFGADMHVRAENSGPVTILLDSRKAF